MEAIQMGWDFWRIEWPNAALLFALAVTPFFAILGFGSNAAQHPATEIVSEPGSLLAMADKHEQGGLEQSGCE
jgi:hypothetical protein